MAYLQSSLLLGSVIHRLSDHIPSAVDIAQVSAVDGSSSGQGEHDGSQWRHLIIDLASLVHIDSLESDLETAAAHAKGHGVHVDVIRQSSTILNCVAVLREQVAAGDGGVDKGLGRVLVVEDGHVDGNLGSTASANVGSQGSNAEEKKIKNLSEKSSEQKRRFFLVGDCVSPTVQCQVLKMSKEYSRETGMCVDDLIWHEQAATGIAIGDVVRLEELAFATETRERGQGNWDFVGLHPALGQGASIFKVWK